jgi:hypothetical protein
LHFPRKGVKRGENNPLWEQPIMDAPAEKVNWPLGLLGALAGSVAGYLLFFGLAQFGLLAIAAPGAMVGFGCSFLSRGRSTGLGIVCACMALALGLFTDWRLQPFIADDSLSYYLAHVMDLTPLTKISVVVGAVIAYWIGTGR